MKQRTWSYTLFILLTCSFISRLAWSDVPITVGAADDINSSYSQSDESHADLNDKSTLHTKMHRKHTALAHSIAEVRAQLRLLDMQIAAAKEETKDLHDRQQLYHDAVMRQWQDLAALIRMSYFLEHMNPIKVVFGQQNMTQLDRYLQYEKLLDQARYQTIQQIQSALLELQKTQAALQMKSQTLQVQRKQLLAKKQTLERLQKQ